MKSKLLSAVFGGLLLLGSGLALADDGGRGRHDRGGHQGWHDRGSGGGPRWGHPQHYRGHGHGHLKHHRWGRDHYRDYGWRDRQRYHGGHHGHYGERYADRGNDLTIIFRGSLD